MNWSEVWDIISAFLAIAAVGVGTWATVRACEWAGHRVKETLGIIPGLLVVLAILAIPAGIGVLIYGAQPQRVPDWDIAISGTVVRIDTSSWGEDFQLDYLTSDNQLMSEAFRGATRGTVIIDPALTDAQVSWMRLGYANWFGSKKLNNERMSHQDFVLRIPSAKYMETLMGQDAFKRWLRHMQGP